MGQCRDKESHHRGGDVFVPASRLFGTVFRGDEDVPVPMAVHCEESHDA